MSLRQGTVEGDLAGGARVEAQDALTLHRGEVFIAQRDAGLQAERDQVEAPQKVR